MKSAEAIRKGRAKFSANDEISTKLHFITFNVSFPFNNMINNSLEEY